MRAAWVPGLALFLTAGAGSASGLDEPVDLDALRCRAMDASYAAAAGHASTTGPAWEDVDDFVYQLQNYHAVGSTREDLRDSAFDVVFMDFSHWYDGVKKWSAEEIMDLKYGRADQPKQVIAYVSIGEASTFREFWDPAWTDQEGYHTEHAPDWLGPRNPDWPESYKVRYWDPEWKSIIFGNPEAWVDQIIGQCFDGIYLDIVDAYWYWGDNGYDRDWTADEMRAFVTEIASYARDRSLDDTFAVIPQNAGALAYDHPEYVDVTTAIGKESTWYSYDTLRTGTSLYWHEKSIEPWRDAGKPVFATDYPSEPAHIDHFYALAHAWGAIPYAGERALDRMIVHPGHEPT